MIVSGKAKPPITITIPQATHAVKPELYMTTKSYPDHPGRPGERGGSLPRGADLVNGAKECESHPGDKLSLKASNALNKQITDMIWMPDHDADLSSHWESVTMADRSRCKDVIVTQLSQQTGIPKGIVNDFIRTWAGSSNDTSMRSLSVQQAISEEFGVPLSKWQQGQIVAAQEKVDQLHERRVSDNYEYLNNLHNMMTGTSGMYDDAKNKIDNLYQEYGTFPYTFAGLSDTHPEDVARMVDIGVPEDMTKLANAMANFEGSKDPTDSAVLPIDQSRQLVRQMYDNTQQALAEQGLQPDDTITLYRGFNFVEEKIPTDPIKHLAYIDMLKNGDEPDVVAYPQSAINKVVGYKGNAAESWSASSSVAQTFGANVVGISVPVKNILSTAGTGFGCVNEGEFVVLGNNKIRARVIYTR